MVSESKKVREILFRGQTRRYGEKVRMGDGFKLPSRWVYGGVLQGVSDHSIIYGGENADDPGDGLDKWVVYTDTLGQFTGLTDKNGKKIFEGDILLLGGDDLPHWYEEGMVVAVSYECDGFTPLCEYDSDCGTYVDSTKCEVIGNSHDNPELLEGCDG